MKNKKILIPFFIFLMLIFNVFAWMPDTHNDMNAEALHRAGDTPLARIVENDFADFVGCDILTDISVFAYFNDGLNKIGTKYKQTHSQSLCTLMVGLAQNERELACAYGVCAHHVQDAVAHNDFVPTVVRRTKLVNGLVHIFAEEKVNDEIRNLQLSSQTRNFLGIAAAEHRGFFKRALASQNLDFPFEDLFDAFTDEVTGNDKYSVGFRAFTAVPLQIHVFLMLLFIASLVGMGLIIRVQNRNIFNNISIVLLLIIVLTVIAAYALFFTGDLWMFFQTASEPISNLMPTQGWEQSVEKSISETVNFLRNGETYVLSVTPDPAGSAALTAASNSGSGTRTVANIILGIVAAIFVWLNIRRK